MFFYDQFTEWCLVHEWMDEGVTDAAGRCGAVVASSMALLSLCSVNPVSYNLSSGYFSSNMGLNSFVLSLPPHSTLRVTIGITCRILAASLLALALALLP